MKHKPQTPIFALLSLVAAVSAVAIGLEVAPLVLFAAQQKDSADSTAADSTPEPVAESSRTAGEVLDAVREKLESVDSLTTEIHEDVVFSGQRLAAIGRYQQASGNRVRLEFRLYPVRPVQASDAEFSGIGDKPQDKSKMTPSASLTQVSDGSMLWSLWQNGNVRQLTRQNIREILDALPEDESWTATSLLQDLGVGGLQALLAKIQATMEFGPVREQRIGEADFLVVTGRWTGASRQNLFSAPDPQTPLPEFVPEFVRIYVDAQALLPRRIQYLKKHPDPEQKLVKPLVTLDFRKLAINQAIPDETFTFEVPEGVVEENLTSRVIEQIRQIANPQAANDNESAGKESETAE